MQEKITLKNKKILVTGGTGMIGRSLIRLLKQENPSSITSVSLDDTQIEGVLCLKTDITRIEVCHQICKDADIVFHLAGIKGSPKMTAEKPASFFVPMLMFNTNMMHAAMTRDVEWYLYTSSVGVYGPSAVFVEDELWNSNPSNNDWFAGWAKRMGELQAEAYKIQNGKSNCSIVRPANVYGEYDNFNPETCMVIPALIHRVFSGENPLNVWGNGTAIRDFIYSDDVARAMLFVTKYGITEPVNAGSGTGVTIGEIVSIICHLYTKYTGKNIEVKWDITKPSGDACRMMSMEKMARLGFKNQVSLYDGIELAIKWYLKNQETIKKRYDVFTK